MTKTEKKVLWEEGASIENKSGGGRADFHIQAAREKRIHEGKKTTGGKENGHRRKGRTGM